jgi:ferredoxin
MPALLTGFLAGIGILFLAVFCGFGFLSLREGERRAAGVSFAVALLGLLPLGAAAWLPAALQAVLSGMLAAGGAAALVFFILPIGRIARNEEVPRKRHDERDIPFSRWRLRPGTPDYEGYYALRPERRAADDELRALPGLLSPKASKAHSLYFASAAASFALTEALREAVDGPLAPERTEVTSAAITAFLKARARAWGAREVGVAELQPYAIYTHVGRGSGIYGEKITLSHRWAIAFTVEMDHAILKTAPEAPVVAESARRYAEAARIAVPMASLIRSLGFPARAHIDGNYRVIAPLVARDAGLGEIGRMGLLMTPGLGPRVRLGVVTTDLPLAPDPRPRDGSVIDFCSVCRKCAENCPARAIPFDDRKETDGALRWRIDPERCFHYWCAIGTDCGRCLTVCPYSHPGHPGHRLVRWAARSSGAARRAARWLDDAFYGRRPAPWPVPAKEGASSG